MALKRRSAEWVLVGYAALVVSVAATRIDRYPAAGWAIGAHLGVIGLVGLFQSARLGRVGSLAREIAPIVLLLALYGALDLVSGFGAVATHDPTVQGWELSLFGEQISRTWWQRQPSGVASSVFHAAYFVYYVLVPFPVILYLARARPQLARRATGAILVTFAICYAIFLLLPVAGPYYEFPRPAEWFIANPPARAVYAILNAGSSYGAAFPSSHVAATWISVWALSWDAPRWAVGLSIPATLLTVGVVYCQMHYAVDALAGLAVAGVVATVGRNARGS
ncbi:MAG: phosphatase PAP2 family protein [Gemmatimonadetes bacterium]|nr:phosphatase PAP2 family protein [Gemmatimonadota bacterium]